MARPASDINAGAPGSDLAGETAAALAAGALAFQGISKHKEYTKSGPPDLDSIVVHGV